MHEDALSYYSTPGLFTDPGPFAGNVVRDVLSLNKVEILPWDGGWGYLTQEAMRQLEDEGIAGAFDRMSSVTPSFKPGYEELRRLYETDKSLPPSPEFFGVAA